MNNLISRRTFLKKSGAWGALIALNRILPAYAQPDVFNATPLTQSLSGDVIDLVIARTSFQVGDRTAVATTINGTVPGPLLRLREGQDITLNVTNQLDEATSIHWHGILLSPDMDGVPGVSFSGIAPGTTFSYRFKIQQYGTYWFHSHSGGQEQAGMYAPIIIDPIEPDPVQYDREYVIMLSDWSFASVNTMIAKLKKQPGYFNFQKRTLGDFIQDVRRDGLFSAFDDYLMWAKMRMDPTDLADVTGHAYTYLLNGFTPAANWTGLFRLGERIRLRFIQAGAMTFQDIRIPGLRMTVVQADGQNVQPVTVDELRIGPAETYDVIVEPKEERAYTIFAETLDRSGFACGTLAPRPGMTAAIPPQRPRPLRTMADMGMRHDASGSLGEHAQGNTHGGHGEHTHPEHLDRRPVRHGADDHGPGNQSIPDFTWNRMDEPGIGLGNDGRRVLVYTDLKSLTPYPDQREPERELEIHLTGHMERFMWSFDGQKYSDAREPIRFYHGERLRWIFVNDTMMEHTIHLHGMWMYLENGAGAYLPRKHTVLVKPAERVPVLITADAPGLWAFHCHLLLHMETGMFRVIEVLEAASEAKS